MQGAEDAVKYDPDQRNKHGRVIVRDLDIGASGFDVVARKLLLAARTFVFRREEPQDHFHDENRPRNIDDNRDFLQTLYDRCLAVQPETDISDDQQDEQHRPVDQADIMHGIDNAQTFFVTHLLQLVSKTN